MKDITQADRAAAHTWWMHREHDERDLPAYFARHREEGAAEERAKIVAWLRNLAGYPASALEGYPPRGEVWVLHRSADAIEAGEHLKYGGNQ